MRKIALGFGWAFVALGIWCAHMNNERDKRMFPSNEKRITTFSVRRPGDDRAVRFFGFDNGQRMLIVNDNCHSYGSWMSKKNFVKEYREHGEQLNLDTCL